MSAEDVVEFLRLMEEKGIDVHLDGGWGVDALLGLQTRSHEDLDIAVQHKDVPALRGLLEARGYREFPSADAKDFNFVLADSRGRKIDVHSYTFDPQGSHVYGIALPDRLTDRDGHYQRTPRQVHIRGMGSEVPYPIRTRRN